MDRGNQNWLYNCEYAMELPKDKNEVPHYLPGQNPWLGEFEAKHAMPKDGVRGGAETLLPDWKPGAPRAATNPAKNGGFKPEVLPQRVAAGDVKAVHVQGNVHMIVGAGRTSSCRSARTDPRRRYRIGRADREGVGGDQAAGSDERDPLDRQHRYAGRSHRWQRGACEGGPDRQRKRRRDRRARECVGANAEGGSARYREALQHLLRRPARLPVQRRAGDALSRRIGARRHRTRW